MTLFAAAVLLPAFAADLRYPESRRTDLVETLHGREVADPYRWLEDANSAETKAWVEAQNKTTFAYLSQIPERKAIAKRFGELMNYEKFGVPSRVGGRYFWTYNTGLQNQDVLYWSSSLRGKRKVLLDPNRLSQDGTVALSGSAISWNGKLLAYSLSKGGSDWQEWRVRDVATGKDLTDRISWSKFSGASWDIQDRGFYYSRYDAPKSGGALQEQNYYQKLYYHRLGTPQSRDVLVYQRKDRKDWGFGGTVTEDGRYLVISVWQGTNRENGVLIRDLKNPSQPVRELLMKFDAQYTFVGNIGTKFYFQTDRSAPMGRVVGLDLAAKAPSAVNVVPESKESLQAVTLVGGRLIANYLKDAYTQVRVFTTAGRPVRTVNLPGIGSASGFGGLRKDRTTYYSYASFDTPPTVYAYDVDSGRSSRLWQPRVGFLPSNFVTRQVFYTSRDGTRIPMFVTHRKGLALDGSAPTLLYGYGGFNVPMTPFFSPSRLLWMEMGGVSAVACIRGGAEYGKAWHDGGRLFQKRNCFDDFIAGAEWLIENRYTSTPRLAIKGESNGGLLVGACLNQRPDLFGVAFPEVGVMDMLRFHKFTIGWAWTSDYGSPDKKEDFEYLVTYSPYHNVKKGTRFPATMVMTADHDDRVVPAHSFKYAAALQWAQAGDAPVLIRIETQAGHGAGKPTAKIIEETADRWSFAIRNMRYSLPAGFGK